MDGDYFIGYLIGLATILLTGKPLLRGLEQEANKVAPNAILDQGASLEAYKRGNMSGDDLANELAQEGLNSDRIQILQLLTEALMNSGDAIVALYRGTITMDDFQSRMTKLGFAANTIKTMVSNFETRLQAGDLIEAEHRALSLPPEIGTTEQETYGSGLTSGRLALLRQLAMKIPQLADLLTFSAWNIGDADFVKKFGLDQNMPDDFIANTAKLGISSDYAKQLWASHWQPVPIFILKELYQTGAISPDQLTALFNVYQIPPGFQASIMAAFSKQLSEAQLVAAVQNGTITEATLDPYIVSLGYNKDAIPVVHAEIMNKAGVPGAADKAETAAQKAEFKSLSVGNIAASYEEGLIDKPTATTYLKDIGIPDDIITFQLNHSDWKVKQSALKDNITNIENMFLEGEIDQTTASSQLASLGVSPVKTNNLIAKWTQAIPGRQKLPTKADADAFLKKSLIDAQQYVDLLTQIGYAPIYILLYYADAAGETLAQAQSDLSPYLSLS